MPLFLEPMNKDTIYTLILGIVGTIQNIVSKDVGEANKAWFGSTFRSLSRIEETHKQFLSG